MHKSFRIYIPFILLIILQPTHSQEMAVVTLENGSRVKLNDDFTWEYIILESQSMDNNTITADANQKAMIPLSQAVPLASTAAETLTANAITQAALLKSTAKNGVKITFVDSQWDSNRLGLTFEVASKSPENYVLIELGITLFADSGALIKKQTANVWQASFRLPETYLRNNQVRNSRIIWIDGIDKTQWQKKLMSLKIEAMNSRG